MAVPTRRGRVLRPAPTSHQDSTASAPQRVAVGGGLRQEVRGAFQFGPEVAAGLQNFGLHAPERGRAVEQGLLQLDPLGLDPPVDCLDIGAIDAAPCVEAEARLDRAPGTRRPSPSK